MSPNKSIAYQGWLNDLATYSPKDFLSHFIQFLRLLEAENKKKIALLDRQFITERKRLDKWNDLALKELKPLTSKVDKSLTSAGKLAPNAPFDTQNFKSIVSGETWISGYRSQNVFHAIRLTIETLATMDKAKEFTDILSKKNDIIYVDYDKFSAKYPAYAKFVNNHYAFEEKEKVEPWGHYAYLKYRDDFTDSFFSQDAGHSMKPRYLDRLKLLVMYLITPDMPVEESPKAQNGIPRLFSLSAHPTALKGEGNNKTEWIDARGKTQPYAILQLASNKYNKNLQVKGVIPDLIKLSLKEIEDYLSDPKNCNRQPNWQGLRSDKRKLELFIKNINSKIPFSDDVLYVDGSNDTYFLCFKVPA